MREDRDEGPVRGLGRLGFSDSQDSQEPEWPAELATLRTARRGMEILPGALIGTFAWKFSNIFGSPENGSGAATDVIRSSVHSRM